MVTIALDAMGGDHGPEVVIPAAGLFLKRHTQARVVLVGDVAVLEPLTVDVVARFGDRIALHHASQQVEMDESPAQALRTKKDSSMRVAINLVKQEQADACVSAGNTGALMATARFVLKMLPGIDRPAIISTLPSMTGHTHMLDLGANVDLSAEQLFQLAVMGSVLVSAVENVKQPRISLLNIGSEEIKGSGEIKRAAGLLAASQLNYVGYIEADAIYTDSDGVDVVVCDGFVGNIALKASEGVAKMIGATIRETFLSSFTRRIIGLLAAPTLRRVYQKFDPRRYNGASLLGLQGIVIKSHGGADTLAFANAIEIALLEVDKMVPQTIGHELGRLLQNPAAA